MSAILQASPSPITLAPIHNTFALLCCFVASALKQSWHNAARDAIHFIGCHAHADTGTTD